MPPADSRNPTSTLAPLSSNAETQPTAEATPARLNTGLVTIESDLQRADQSTGVVTATGNVRIVYPDQRVLATARQAQFFSREGRVVLSGDVEIIQEDGNRLQAERVIYLVDSERMVALPPEGRQVLSRFRIPTTPSAPASGAASAQPESAQPPGVRP